MAFTADDIAQLKAAIATGATRVKYADGREVEYRSLAEMREILRTMQGEVSPGTRFPHGRSSVAGF